MVTSLFDILFDKRTVNFADFRIRQFRQSFTKLSYYFDVPEIARRRREAFVKQSSARKADESRSVDISALLEMILPLMT